MPTWRVTLNGDAWHLGILTRLGVGVSEEGNAFVLRSAELDTLTNAGAVQQRALYLVEAINGPSRMGAGDFPAGHGVDRHRG